MNRLFSRIQKWRFDKKMRTFVSLSIACTTIFILIASAVLFWFISVTNSRKISEYQLSALAENFSADFIRYKDMAIALILNTSIQEYLSFPKEKNVQQYYSYASQAKEMLLSICNLNPAVYSIAVMNSAEDDFVIRLRNSRYISIFSSVYRKDIAVSFPLGNGMLRITYDKAYTGSDEKTLNIYFPVYSASILHAQLGTMCISLVNDQLFQIADRSGREIGSDTYFINGHGIVLVSGDGHEVRSRFPHFDRMTKASGHFWVNGNLFIYRSITGWGYYLVQKIPKNALFTSSVHIFFLLLAVILLMVCLSIGLSDKMVNNAYRPLDNILHTMNLVRNDRLEIRIDCTRFGEDFAQLAAGFNSMMDEIERLVCRVKQDQQEKSRIQLNALQSQIQPHFLYNTLECIHWQAMADGNHEIAKMGMALASYYRICLSGGKDLISLSQEIQHVKNYLLIQNMRYGNIIESDIVVDPGLSDVRIPKISLQPLVENAISHGARLKEGIREFLKITAVKEGTDVFIRVENSGFGISVQEIDRMNALLLQLSDSPGYGIRNVHRRIQLYFGTDYGLSFSANALGGVTVCVHIPYVDNSSDMEDNGDV